MVRKLGADIVVDYTREHFEQVLCEYDGALDLIGGDTLLKTFGVVKRHAKVVSIAGVPEPQTASKDLQAGPTLAILFWQPVGESAAWRVSTALPIGTSSCTQVVPICQNWLPSSISRGSR